MATYPELSGRVAAITGGAQGIGAATARAFAKQGAHVAVLDIDGAGAVFGFQNMAVLTGVSGVTLTDMVTNGNLDVTV